MPALLDRFGSQNGCQPCPGCSRGGGGIFVHPSHTLIARGISHATDCPTLSGGYFQHFGPKRRSPHEPVTVAGPFLLVCFSRENFRLAFVLGGLLRKELNRRNKFGFCFSQPPRAFSTGTPGRLESVPSAQVSIAKRN